MYNIQTSLSFFVSHLLIIKAGSRHYNWLLHILQQAVSAIAQHTIYTFIYKLNYTLITAKPQFAKQNHTLITAKPLIAKQNYTLITAKPLIAKQNHTLIGIKHSIFFIKSIYSLKKQST